MNPDRFGVVASDIEPTAHQAALLRHLVATGQPWITPAPAPPRRRGLLPAPQGRVAPGFRIAGGLSVRIYTVRIVLEAGWLLGLREGPVETPGWMGVITPAGREALQRVNAARLEGIEEYAASLSPEQRTSLLAVLTALPHAEDRR